MQQSKVNVLVAHKHLTTRRYGASEGNSKRQKNILPSPRNDITSPTSVTCVRMHNVDAAFEAVKLSGTVSSRFPRCSLASYVPRRSSPDTRSHPRPSASTSSPRFLSRSRERNPRFAPRCFVDKCSSVEWSVIYSDVYRGRGGKRLEGRGMVAPCSHVKCST